MLESAVRVKLELEPDEALTSEELASVTELYLYGDQTAASWDEFNTLRNDVFSGKTVIGTDAVSSLDDLTKLPNLTQLALAQTKASDLSPLSKATKLDTLELFYSPATDFSPIANLSNLRHLVIQSCEYLTDISFLANCKNLRELVLIGDDRLEDFSALAGVGELQYLHLEGVEPERFLLYLNGKTIHQLKIGWHPLSSLAELAGIAQLQELICNGIDFNSLEGGEQLTALERLTIHAADDQTDMSLTPLLNLPKLNTLTLSENLRQAAETELAGAPF